MPLAQEIQQGFVKSFGTGCFLGYFIILCTCHSEAMLDLVPCTAAAGIFLVVFLLLSARFADHVDFFGPARLSMIGCILCAFGLFAFEFPFQIILYGAAGIASVIGFGIFLLILGKNLAYYEHKERFLQICCAFLLSATFAGIASFLDSAGSLIFELLLLAAIVLHLYTLKPNSSTYCFANLSDSKKDYRFEWTTLLTTGLTGLVWGIAFFACTHREPSAPESLLYMAIPVALGALAGIVGMLCNHMASERVLLRMFSTLAFIGIMPLPFVPDYLFPFIGSYLFLAFLLDMVVCLSAMAEVARFNQVSPYWIFGESLASYFAGTVAGFIAFGTAFSIDGEEARLIVTMATMLIVVWASSYAFQDRYPSDDRDHDNTRQAVDESESKPALWQGKIEAVISEYKLTARQQEVFRMLVRGRNASYIADTFVISISTSKAHIHNIYRKLNIHSQQELINLVEAADPLPNCEEIPDDQR